MSEPKPFDLEKAKAGEAIMFIEAGPVEFVAHYPPAPKRKRVIVMAPNSVYLWADESGYSSVYKDTLVMTPKKRTVTVRLYQRKLNRVEAAWVNSHPAVLQDWTLLQEWTKEVPE